MTDDDEVSELEALKLRKFLKDGCEFTGLRETAIAVLQKETSKTSKLKPLASKIEQIFRLSEDYDSDESDIEDDLKWLLRRKKILKRLKKIDTPKLEIEGKIIKLVKK